MHGVVVDKSIFEKSNGLEASMSWTPDRVDSLKKMWSDGQSASQIANDLGGVTRNAVIGKIHRLGLSNRGTVTSKDKQTTINIEKESKVNLKKKNIVSSSNSKEPKVNVNQESKNRKSFQKDVIKPLQQHTHKPLVFTATQPLPPQPSTSEISEETLKNVQSIEKKSRKLSLMELTERTCKWPIGDPATEKFWFCGHVAEAGKPYCETHIEIAFQPVASRRERRSR